jgi:hypothetical protein
MAAKSIAIAAFRVDIGGPTGIRGIRNKYIEPVHDFFLK